MLRIGFRPLTVSTSQSKKSMSKRLQDHYPSVCRFILGGTATVSCYYGLLDPYAGLYAVSLYAEGAALLWLMGAIGAVLVLDVLINDWTPDQVHIAGRHFKLNWRRTFKYRHYLFASLAFCYAAQPFVAERGGHSVSLLLFFYWHACINIAVAFLDAKQRSRIRGPGWQRACN